jgi:hypothetical protein
MLRGIEAGAWENGLGLLVYCTAEEGATGTSTPYPLGEHNTGGLIVFVDRVSNAELVRLNQIEPG